MVALEHAGENSLIHISYLGWCITLWGIDNNEEKLSLKIVIRNSWIRPFIWIHPVINGVSSIQVFVQ